MDADDTLDGLDNTDEGSRASAGISWKRRVVTGAIGALGFALALACLAFLALNTSPGRDFVKRQIEALEFENGLGIGIGAIDGSLFGDMTIRDLTLSDPQGVFASAPEVRVSWHPFAYLWGRIDVDAVRAPVAMWERFPELRDTGPSDAPLLPDLDIDLDEIAIERLEIGPSIAGSARHASVFSEVHIADRRAQVALDATSVASGDEAPSGDVVRLVMDAVPDANRLGLDLEIDAPADGVIAAIANLPDRLTARLQGEGDWAQWDGRLEAELSQRTIIAAQLTARDGTFAFSGDANAAALAPEALAKALAGSTSFTIKAAVSDGPTRIDAQLSSPQFALDAAGDVALAQGKVSGVVAELSLPDISVLGSSLEGADLEARARLDGDISRPDIAFDVSAARIMTNAIGLDGFAIKGATRLDPTDMTLPVSAQAERVVGLDQATGGPVTNVALTGDILIAWPRLVSDNLRLRSPRLDAGLTFVADAAKGRYGGSIDGRIGDYRVESVGLFDAASEAAIEGSFNDGLALEGTLQARSTQVTNAGVDALLGGEALASSKIAYDRDGTARFFDLRLEAPKLSVDEGEGRYSASGAIAVTASGASSEYGPLGLQVTGTLDRPVAVIEAPNPDLGVGLAKVVARVEGNGGRYRIDANADSDYGPVATLMTADFSGETLVLDIDRSEVGGIGLTGRLRQDKAGLFAGDLAATGKGFSGFVRLSSAAKAQLARVNLRARDLALPGAAGLRVRRGLIDANVTFSQRVRVSGDVQLAGAQVFSASVDKFRAQVNLEDGAGSAKMVAVGAGRLPYRIAANVELAPDLWRAAIAGKARGVEFATATPARIVPGKDDYKLLPTTIEFDQGRVQLSGRYGSSVELKSELEELELAIVNRFVPGLGVSGRATGSLDFAQANETAFPTANARLRIDGFSRSTALTVSQPVDVNFVAQVREQGGAARAVVRQQGTVIGRLNASLAPPLAQGDSWLERLAEAPLGGGLRYTGPAETVFSLAGLANHRLTGAIGVAADFSGRLLQPELTGIVRANRMSYENTRYGTQLTDIELAARFTGDEFVLETFEAAAGKGTLSAAGTASLAAEAGFPMDVTVTFDRAQLASRDSFDAAATGEVSLVKRPGERALVSGTLKLPETRYVLKYAAAEEVPQLSGVRFDTQIAEASVARAETRQTREPGLRDVRLDLRIVASDRLFVSGVGLQSEWSADLRLTGTSADPRLTGEIELARGTLDFAGRTFDLETGNIRFTDDSTLEPNVDLSATETIEDVAVTVNVSGRAYSPDFNFSSSPALPQEEILSRILFGSSVANLSALEAVQLAQSLNALSGSGGGLNPLGSLRSATGIDRLRLLGSDEQAGRETALAAGQYIADDIYVEVITDARGFTATQLELSLTPALSVLSQAGGQGGTNVSVRYRKDY
ncbi:MAG: translocation/assembly module TamB domain-containing protein [Erythrobacter sp.]|uniref:translocation/assembly module TamB domain-containing protein n=1 Tax=Erythrobacter sp. TaxID=1042 RepID=UPI002617F2FF|nr:translocation/assembly module TamB domain-containing protein [Erythrobacter sp.]MDJ0979684.1 translocation/assembly module TamB domain-containing protein [Erythrobacter sp.]